MLPLGNAMTTATSENITLAAINVQPQSCSISAPAWLGLAAGVDSNAVWSVLPTSTGAATIVTSCRDFRSNPVTATDTLRVFPKPLITPDISGTVPVDLGDSINVAYDSANTLRVDVTCSHCDSLLTMRRVAANMFRLAAVKMLAKDTAHRAICFSVTGLDGRFNAQSCVGVVIEPLQASTWTVPAAIRAAEVIPLHTIPLATYDGTGQSIHPDFLRPAAAWANGACWMSYTPYYGSNEFLENPSLATSPDCEHWSPAAGISAPLVARPQSGYNSDPELLYDAQRGCLGVMFRQVATANAIMMTSTCDGKSFSTPRTLFTAPNHSAVSPSVATGPDGFNRVYYVDAGTLGCTSQNNTVKMRAATTDTASLASLQFYPEVPTDLVQPGYIIWHIKVRYVPALQQYVAMYAAFPPSTGVGDCTNDDLFIATSADGVHWQTFPTAVLNHLDKRFAFESMYRASFQYDAASGQLHTIVSALDTKSNWGQYGVTHNWSVLVSALKTSTTASPAQLAAPAGYLRVATPSTHKRIVEDP